MYMCAFLLWEDCHENSGCQFMMASCTDNPLLILRQCSWGRTFPHLFSDEGHISLQKNMIIKILQYWLPLVEGKPFSFTIGNFPCQIVIDSFPARCNLFQGHHLSTNKYMSHPQKLLNGLYHQLLCLPFSRSIPSSPTAYSWALGMSWIFPITIAINSSDRWYLGWPPTQAQALNAKMGSGKLTWS